MSELQEIEVTIGSDGRLTVDVRGAKGPKCLAFTKEMEALLGGVVIARDLSGEYHEQPLEEANVVRLHGKE